MEMLTICVTPFIDKYWMSYTQFNVDDGMGVLWGIPVII